MLFIQFLYAKIFFFQAEDGIRDYKVTGAQTCALPIYPYVAGSTGLESALFDPGWQERMRIGYGDLQWVKTGERLTAETFARYRKEGGQVVIFMIPEIGRASCRERVERCTREGGVGDSR